MHADLAARRSRVAAAWIVDPSIVTAAPRSRTRSRAITDCP